MSRAEPSVSLLVFGLFTNQTKWSGSFKIKSSEHFSSSKYFERASCEVRAIWTTVSPHLNLEKLQVLSFIFIVLYRRSPFFQMLIDGLL
ncbi:hypothetical protein Hanom_Chr16g01480111 [Helianthus anomalus]